MKFYQRIEVWVLLLAVAVAVVFVLKPRPDTEVWEQGAELAESAAAQRVSLLGATLERDYGNARLDLEVRVTNSGAHPLLLTPPQARLLAGPEGVREVPPFFLPAERPPEISPGATSEVRLRYWLEAADLQGPLWLVVGEDKVPVKSAEALDLEQVENRKALRLRGVEW